MDKSKANDIKRLQNQDSGPKKRKLKNTLFNYFKRCPSNKSQRMSDSSGGEDSENNAWRKDDGAKVTSGKSAFKDSSTRGASLNDTAINELVVKEVVMIESSSKETIIDKTSTKELVSTGTVASEAVRPSKSPNESPVKDVCIKRFVSGGPSKMDDLKASAIKETQKEADSSEIFLKELSLAESLPREQNCGNKPLKLNSRQDSMEVGQEKAPIETTNLKKVSVKEMSLKGTDLKEIAPKQDDSLTKEPIRKTGTTEAHLKSPITRGTTITEVPSKDGITASEAAAVKEKPIKRISKEFTSKVDTPPKRKSRLTKIRLSQIGRGWTRHSDRDTAEYRKGYPKKRDFPNKRKNKLFYTNNILSRPRGGYIDDILRDWYGDYARLEAHHGYIQWLFPIREEGMNMESQELQLHEAEAIQADPKAYARVLKAYKLMLDFYGMRLKNVETGELERANNWRLRYKNLRERFHNYLRITRILKSLGELGYEHLKAPFVRFMLYEALEEAALEPVLESALNFWVNTIKDDADRQDLKDYAMEFIEDG